MPDIHEDAIAHKQRFISGLLFAYLVICQACVAPDMSSNYAIDKVMMPSGLTVYFKREVRGITGNYDMIAISLNGDPCRSYDENTDYGIWWNESDIYYKVASDTIHLYGATVSRFPKTPVAGLRIERHEVHPIDRAQFLKDYSRRSIMKMTLVADEKIKCK